MEASCIDEYAIIIVMYGRCQEPSCGVTDYLLRFTVKPGIYLWLCHEDVRKRAKRWFDERRPAFLAQTN